MLERPDYKVVERGRVIPQTSGSGVLRAPHDYPHAYPVYAGNVAPSPKILDALMEQARTPQNLPSRDGGVDRHETRALDVRVQRTGGIFSVMSRIGLESAIPFKTIKTLELTEG